MDSHAREQAFGQYLLGRSLLSQELLRQALEVSADTRDPLVRSLAKLRPQESRPLRFKDPAAAASK